MQERENIEENKGDGALRRVTISLPSDVHAAAEQAAEAEDRSLSNYVTRLIKQSVAKPEEVAS